MMFFHSYLFTKYQRTTPFSYKCLILSGFQTAYKMTSRPSILCEHQDKKNPLKIKVGIQILRGHQISTRLDCLNYENNHLNPGHPGIECPGSNTNYVKNTI